MCDTTISPQNLKRVEMFGAATDTLSSFNAATRARGDAEYAARLAEARAADALSRGASEAARRVGEGRRQQGTIRTQTAASGFEIGEGTAADFEESADFLARLDARTIRENAEREAFGHRAQARQLSAQADSISPFGAATGTLMGQVGTLSRRWQQREAVGADGGDD